MLAGADIDEHTEQNRLSCGESRKTLENVPPGLKPPHSVGFIGKAKAVPFQNRLTPRAVSLHRLPGDDSLRREQAPGG